MDRQVAHFTNGNSGDHRAFFRSIYDRFEFYRERMRQVRLGPKSDVTEILNRLPILSPQDSQALGKEVLCRLATKRFLVDLSSGTTGERKVRFSTERDDAAEASICRRFFGSWGLSRRDRVLAVDIDSADIYLFYGDVLFDLGIRDLMFASLGDDPRQIECIIRDMRPTTIVTVPSVLNTVLRLCDDRLLEDLERVVYIGEVMSARLRSRLVKNKVEVYSLFGSTEIGSFAGECGQHNGMHISLDAVIPTLLSPRISRESITGEAVWSTLHFRDHPLVKYPTHDYIELSTVPCRCGDASPRIVRVNRLQAQFIVYGHKFSYRSFIESLREQSIAPGFFQIVVEDYNNRVKVTFSMPSELRYAASLITDTLKKTGEISYFEDRSFLECEFKFADEPVVTGRKVRPVVDLRTE